MRHVLLHGHMFKNAGTTLDWSLRRSFGAGFCEHRDDAAMREAPDHALAVALRNKAVVALSSHNLPCPPPVIPGVHFHCVFLLRHPIARILSVYVFERAQQAQTPGALAAKRLDLRDYIAWRLQDSVRPVIRNFQTRFLAGAAARQAGAPLSDTAVAAARRRLVEGSLFGIVERYDESMVVLESALRPHFPDLDLAYLAQNVGRAPRSAGDSLRERLGPLWHEVRAHNAEDLALYEQAVQSFDRQVTAIPDFALRLDHFRQRRKSLAS